MTALAGDTSTTEPDVFFGTLCYDRAILKAVEGRDPPAQQENRCVDLPRAAEIQCVEMVYVTPWGNDLSTRLPRLIHIEDSDQEPSSHVPIGFCGTQAIPTAGVETTCVAACHSSHRIPDRGGDVAGRGALRADTNPSASQDRAPEKVTRPLSLCQGGSSSSSRTS